MCTGSLYQKTVKHQFDYLCIKSLKGEAANYIKAMDCRQKKEILFSEMTQADQSEAASRRYFVYDGRCSYE